MSLQILPYRFQVRGGTAADLATVNEVPLRRELVFEMDTGKAKLGDGVTNWNDLEYIAGGGTISMQVSGGYIQYSNDSGATWNNLIAVADLEGPPGPPGDPGTPGAPGTPGDDGREVQLQATATHIQWRYVGEPGWTNLVALADLEGPAGPQGPAGGPTNVISTSGDISLSAAMHKGKFLLHDTGEITCPATAAAGFVVDDIVEVRRNTAGAVTFVASGGAALDFNDALYAAEINNPKDVVALKVIATDTWALLGPLADA